MAETEKNNLGAVQGNLTAADNARKKRDDLYKKGYSSHPDKAKRDEYAAVGEEIDANYNTAFAEIRRLEKETRSQPIKFRALTAADRERAQTVKGIKDQIPFQTRLAEELLGGLVRSRKIAPLQERNENFKEVKSALIKNEFQKQQAPVSENFKKVKDILVQESINQNEGQNKDQVNDATIEDITSPRIKESNSEAVKPSGRLYRVMFAGKGAEASQTYETKEEADAALKKAGGNGAVAGINFSQQQKPGTKAKVFNRNYLMGRLGEELSAEETEARKKAYLDKDAQAYANKAMYDDSLKKLKEKIKEVRKPEYKAAVKESIRLANEAKRAKDYGDGAGFRSFKANVKAGRESEGVLNDYNSQLGLLRSAYNQARQAGQPLTALKIQRSIQRYQEGVPKEMGERQKFAESGMLKERNDMLAKKLQEAEEAEEEERKKRELAAANSDARNYMR